MEREKSEGKEKVLKWLLSILIFINLSYLAGGFFINARHISPLSLALYIILFLFFNLILIILKLEYIAIRDKEKAPADPLLITRLVDVMSAIAFTILLIILALVFKVFFIG